MPYSSTIVKSTLTASLAGASMRTLRTIAHYRHVPRTAMQTKAQLAQHLAHTLTTAEQRLMLRRVISPADRDLWNTLWRGTFMPPITNSTHLCPWGAPWADLATMPALTRLCAVGAIIPQRTAHGFILHLPRQWRRIMRVSLPPAAMPSRNSHAHGYASLMDLLTRCAVGNAPAHPPAWITRLAMHVGWLAHRLGQWRITPKGHGFVQLPWEEQQRLLQYQIIQHPPLRHPLPRWRQIDWHALTTALMQQMHGRPLQPYQDVLAHMVDHATWGKLAHADRVRTIRDWFTTVLIPAGIVSRNDAWVQWHGWTSLKPCVPTLTDTTLAEHPLMPADLRLWAEQWGERTAHGWQITRTSIAQRLLTSDTMTGWAEPLVRHYGHVPPSLQRLVDRVQRQPQVRISTHVILEADAATVADVRANPTLAPLLGRSFSPTAVRIDPKHHAKIQRYLQPTAHPSKTGTGDAATQTTIIGLRIAAQHAPALADQFQAHATALLRQLSPAEQSTVEEHWSVIAHSFSSMEDETPIPAGSPPPPTLPLSSVERPIDHAQHRQQRLTMRYYAPSTHSITRRTIRPLERNGIYLRAWCERANAERTFRLDRIVQLE